MSRIHSILWLLALPFALRAASGAPPEPVGPELLDNGGFEQAYTATKLPAGWGGFSTTDWGDCAGTLRASTAAPHEGARCLELSGVRTQFAAAHSRRLALDPAKAYLLSAWVRTELARGEAAFLVASWSGERRWLSLDRSRSLRGRRPWTRLTLALRPEARPGEAKWVQISFRVTGPSGRGRAWADGISLRECRVPPPPPAIELERRRLLDMTRELLVERRVWHERLAVLRRRRADLERLPAEKGSFADLAQRFGDRVRARTFLTHVARPRAELERGVPEADGQVRAAAGAIRELPTLRGQCLAELEATLALKRRLDARPELRRFVLWAQLAALRPMPVPPRGDLPVPQPTPEFRTAASKPPEEPTEELVDVEVRTRLDRQADAGSVAIVAPPGRGQAAESLQAGLFAADGRLVAFGAQTLAAQPTRLLLRVERPHYWFPDCPYLYTLRIGLFRDGRAADWLERPVAFREIRVVECDVAPTMRHAWGWAAADYTFAVNGQPYFPTGTVCGALGREHLPQAATLFDELWLDFQRTYGNFLPRLAGEWGDVFAREGLTFLASLRPSYQRIRSYASSRKGLEDFRELARDCRTLASHPALLGIEIGNEAELAVWGADLPSVYGRDLWHCFNEANRALRDELAPDVPVAYVRAAHFRSVLPVPRDDYSGVNQYTGRYWGRRATISSDLATLAQAAALDNKPVAITEWNGPKYSWATSGVSGVDEQGAAQYVFDYFQRMTRTPGIVLSTEFVLNWIVTPLEDLTTVPLAEGLKRRAEWRWSLQKGTPWYPSIWPDLLTDTPARRAMRGFQSPLFYLLSAPGDIAVMGADKHPNGECIAQAISGLGRSVRPMSPPRAHELEALDANVLLIGGLADEQPGGVRDLEALRVIGRTSRHFPAPGRFLVQRRVNPWFPDRFLVVVTAADAAAMQSAFGKLTASAEGLRQALAREASCRRALALIDDTRELRTVFGRYVMELPARGFLLGWDDLRTRLSTEELLSPDGQLRPHWADLSAVLLTVHRRLSDDERKLLRTLPRQGKINVIWSAATLDANPDLARDMGIRFGPAHSLTEHFRVRKPSEGLLAVPELGDVAADRVERFARLKPGTKEWNRAMTIREIAEPEHADTVAATTDGKPVVVSMLHDGGSHWVFGADLAAAAAALWRTTQRGVNHRIYDRDTACGLERLFRLVANAMAGHPPRPPGRPRLRATVATDRQSYRWGDTVRVEVRVRDAEGKPCDAAVRVGFLASGGPSGETPRRWAHATRQATGIYVAEAPVAEKPGPDALVPTPAPNPSFRGQRLIAVFADAAREGWVSDWAAHVVRVTPDTAEAAHLAQLARLVENDLVVAQLNVNDKAKWIELAAELVLPAAIQSGKPARLELTIQKIEHDTGGDWMEDVELVLRSAKGEAVRIPVAPGKTLASPRAPVVKQRPEQAIVVDSAHPARFALTWPKPRPGLWTLSLRYLYTDDYHRDDTTRLPRDDPFPRLTIRVK